MPKMSRETSAEGTLAPGGVSSRHGGEKLWL